MSGQRRQEYPYLVIYFLQRVVGQKPAGPGAPKLPFDFKLAWSDLGTSTRRVSAKSYLIWIADPDPEYIKLKRVEISSPDMINHAHLRRQYSNTLLFVCCSTVRQRLRYQLLSSPSVSGIAAFHQSIAGSWSYHNMSPMYLDEKLGVDRVAIIGAGPCGLAMAKLVRIFQSRQLSY